MESFSSISSRTSVFIKYARNDKNRLAQFYWFRSTFSLFAKIYPEKVLWKNSKLNDRQFKKELYVSDGFPGEIWTKIFIDHFNLWSSKIFAHWSTLALFFKITHNLKNNTIYNKTSTAFHKRVSRLSKSAQIVHG